MKVWICTDIPDVDCSMRILAVFSTYAAAEEYQKKNKFVASKDSINPDFTWDQVDIEEWELDKNETSRV